MPFAWAIIFVFKLDAERTNPVSPAEPARTLCMHCSAPPESTPRHAIDRRSPANRRRQRARLHIDNAFSMYVRRSARITDRLGGAHFNSIAVRACRKCKTCARPPKSHSRTLQIFKLSSNHFQTITRARLPESQLTLSACRHAATEKNIAPNRTDASHHHHQQHEQTATKQTQKNRVTFHARLDAGRRRCVRATASFRIDFGGARV